MVREFEGRTEQEAIDAAVEALGLERHEFEVEIVDSQKGGLFGRGKSVRVRVHLPGEPGDYEESYSDAPEPNEDPRYREESDRLTTRATQASTNQEPETDFEHAVVDFVTTLTRKMGFPAEVKVAYREPTKLGLRLDTEHANILIGRKGKNLDSIQLLANVVASRFEGTDVKVVLDTEGYRSRREEQLVRLAQKIADDVQRSRGSKLLEPMNPFERRLIHTTLNDIESIGTESEGDGLYKQVRIFYRGGKR
ncbi:MAG TPA: RNA-binding cell elongation regulator Jag/EloR [Alkalispirochaeta sp.]|nr:RNA-binding cell elongation regulator Jag/EloR [Alkalispirochaeta sp.]